MTKNAPLKYIWYGDDFTGASDTLGTFASAGLRALLCLGVPAADRLAALGDMDAVGIAGAARTMSPRAMPAELEPVGRYAAARGVPLLHYKCCSTFDSSPTTGSLGAAMRILKRHVSNRFMPVIGGQPNLERYCAFGNLFAAAGQGGDIVRLDRHPTMSRHPSTPMEEADLRLHLGAQGVANIDLVDWRALTRASKDELDALIDASIADDGDAVLFDVLDDSHLARIGELLWSRARQEPLLAVGASSVAQATISYWRQIGWAPEAPQQAGVQAAEGPVFALIGSRSPVTARQATVALGSVDGFYCGVGLNVSRRNGHLADFDEQAATCARLLNQGHSVLAYLGPVAEGGPAPIDVARSCGQFLKQVLTRAPKVRRVGIAGGDTSSMAVEALGVWGLGFVGTLARGVSLARAYADDPRLDGIELMLKGGQMGPNDIFELLLCGTADAAQAPDRTLTPPNEVTRPSLSSTICVAS
jgi:3-oxoisoapionate kinase